MGHLSVEELLDIPQALQALFHELLRGSIFVRRKHLLDFFFQDMQNEFIHRFVTAGLCAFLRLFEQVTFDFYFV